jgi:hypothetical protein
MFNTYDSFRPFDVATTVVPTDGSGFVADLSDVKAHRNVVALVHEAHNLRLKTVAAAQRTLAALTPAVSQIRQIIDTAGERTPKAEEAINQIRATVPAAVSEARQELHALRRQMQGLADQVTLTSFMATTVLKHGAKVSEARNQVEMLPATALPRAAREAVETGNFPMLAAVLHRAQQDRTLSADERAAALQVYHETMEPVAECLKRIDRAAHNVFAYTEHQLDALDAYPGRLDPMRMLERANGGSVFPALLDIPEMADSAATMLARGNDTTRTHADLPQVIDAKSKAPTALIGQGAGDRLPNTITQLHETTNAMLSALDGIPLPPAA